MVSKLLLIVFLALAVGHDVSAAIPSFTVARTGGLFFATSDLTTNGVPGLSNGPSRLLVSGVPGFSAKGGQVVIVNTQVWFRRYEGPVNAQDQPVQLALDRQGSITILGSSSGASSDFVTVRYAGDGTPLWTNRYDGGAHLDDSPGHVVVDDAGHAYVVGSSKTTGNAHDLVAIKYAADGTALWTNRYNEFGTNFHGSAGIAVDAARSLIVALGNFDNEPSHHTTIKYDAPGTPLWTNHYRASDFSSDHVNAVGVDQSGNVFQTGTDYATLKYSPGGVPLWTNASIGHFGVPSSLVVDRAGHVIVCGDRWIPGVQTNGLPAPSVRRYGTIKFSSDGTPLWTNLLGTPQYQGGGMPRLLADRADHLIVIGGTPGATAFNADFTLVKLRPDGVPVWTNRFFDSNTIGSALVRGAAVDAAGNIYFTTHTTGPGGTKVTFLTVKYSATGTLLWSQRFDGGGFAYSQALGVNDSGQVYVTGFAGGLGGDGNFATVKYVEYLHYTPPPNFIGTDMFTFVATDASGASATNTVTVTVEAESLWFNPAGTNLRLTAGGPRLRLDGAQTHGWVILYASPDLAQWTPIATNAPVGGNIEFSVAPTGPRQFYRALQWSQ